MLSTSGMGREVGRRAPSASSRYGLAALMLLQLGVFGYLWLGYRAGRGNGATSEYDSARDLRPGDRAPSLSVETLSGGAVDLLHGRAARRPRVLLFDAACGSCAAKQFPTLRHLGRVAQLAVIMPAIPLEVEMFFKKQGMRDALFREPDGEAQRLYNAAWRPRLFAVDERGRVLYVQGFRETVEQAAAHILRAVGGDRGG